MREPVAASDDELVEDVAGVELDLFGMETGSLTIIVARGGCAAGGGARGGAAGDELDRRLFAEHFARRVLDLVQVMLGEPVDEERVRPLDHEVAPS